jgi:hypothetical protein
VGFSVNKLSVTVNIYLFIYLCHGVSRYIIVMRYTYIKVYVCCNRDPCAPVGLWVALVVHLRRRSVHICISICTAANLCEVKSFDIPKVYVKASWLELHLPTPIAQRLLRHRVLATDLDTHTPSSSKNGEDYEARSPTAPYVPEGRDEASQRKTRKLWRISCGNATIWAQNKQS